MRGFCACFLRRAGIFYGKTSDFRVLKPFNTDYAKRKVNTPVSLNPVKLILPPPHLVILIFLLTVIVRELPE